MTEIPIAPGVPSQTFKVDLEGNTYNFRVIYNTRVGIWSMDISAEDGTELVGGVAMVLGANLIDQFNLNIGGLIMFEVGSTGFDATADDLGVRVLLLHLTNDELAEGAELIAIANGTFEAGGFPLVFPATVF